LDRFIRSRLIDWFWERVGKVSFSFVEIPSLVLIFFFFSLVQPRVQMWRGNFVINLLELVIFKLTRAGATEAASMHVKVD
jgi:hypothetical protein